MSIGKTDIITASFPLFFSSLPPQQGLDLLFVRRQQRSLSNQVGLLFPEFGIARRPVFNYDSLKLKLAPIANQNMVNTQCIYINSIGICAHIYLIQDR